MEFAGSQRKTSLPFRISSVVMKGWFTTSVCLVNCLNIDYLEQMKFSERTNDFLGVPIDVDLGQSAVTAPDNARISGSGL